MSKSNSNRTHLPDLPQHREMPPRDRDRAVCELSKSAICEVSQRANRYHCTRVARSYFGHTTPPCLRCFTCRTCRTGRSFHRKRSFTPRQCFDVKLFSRILSTASQFWVVKIFRGKPFEHPKKCFQISLSNKKIPLGCPHATGFFVQGSFLFNFSHHYFMSKHAGKSFPKLATLHSHIYIPRWFYVTLSITLACIDFARVTGGELTFKWH